jgi:hypothetical protein
VCNAETEDEWHDYCKWVGVSPELHWQEVPCRSQYSKYFETGVRTDSGKSFVKCTEDAPEDLKELIYQIHNKSFDGCFPNDWIYEIIWEAFEALEKDKLEDISIEADIYDRELYEWLGNCFSDEYCNQALQNECPTTNITQIIQTRQCLVKEAIYQAVDEFIEEDEQG